MGEYHHPARNEDVFTQRLARSGNIVQNTPMSLISIGRYDMHLCKNDLASYYFHDFMRLLIRFNCFIYMQIVASSTNNERIDVIIKS